MSISISCDNDPNYKDILPHDFHLPHLRTLNINLKQNENEADMREFLRRIILGCPSLEQFYGSNFYSEELLVKIFLQEAQKIPGRINGIKKLDLEPQHNSNQLPRVIKSLRMEGLQEIRIFVSNRTIAQVQAILEHLNPNNAPLLSKVVLNFEPVIEEIEEDETNEEVQTEFTFPVMEQIENLGKLGFNFNHIIYCFKVFF